MTAHEIFPDTPDRPLSDAEINARLAQYSVSLRPAPGKGQWPAGWLPGDDPVELDVHGGALDSPSPSGEGAGGWGRFAQAHAGVHHPQTPSSEEEGAYCGSTLSPVHPAAVFDVEARVRFLDALAVRGNASAAAALVGVSRETVYRARRRYPDFRRLWDAALVHARARSEDELASCAFDGVAVPVLVRGEHVATWRKKDPRYLLAHLARLDRRIAENPDAVRRAERFDEELAAMAGHPAPEDFAEAVESVRERDCSTPADLPPSRDEYRKFARCEAIFDPPEEEMTAEEREEYHQFEAEGMASADVAAGEAWDRWRDAGMELLDRVISGQPGEDHRDQPLETVTSVNTLADAGCVGDRVDDAAPET